MELDAESKLAIHLMGMQLTAEWICERMIADIRTAKKRKDVAGGNLIGSLRQWLDMLEYASGEHSRYREAIGRECCSSPADR